MVGQFFGGGGASAAALTTSDKLKKTNVDIKKNVLKRSPS